MNMRTRICQNMSNSSGIQIFQTVLAATMRSSTDRSGRMERVNDNMNWPRMLLDGISMAMLFNAAVGIGFLLFPQAYSTMFPKEIREAAAPYVKKNDVRKMNLILYPLYLLLFIYWAVSAHYAGIRGFKTLFWTGYAEMTIVSISDFIILDCWLPGKVKHMIKGAGMWKEYNQAVKWRISAESEAK